MQLTDEDEAEMWLKACTDIYLRDRFRLKAVVSRYKQNVLTAAA
ncbi:hypothetical protein ASZ90_020290 [hydrocarbon metagenome]|uniref:Uncharacterized protein n=1 Tax=hydrocarbon metagenome TaxID=938273 RepID=A0A0W8E1M2_9ZZZZ